MKCFPLCHDWQTVEWEDDHSLRNKVFKELGKGESSWSFDDDYYKIKVCLKCGKIVDEITPALQYWRDHYCKEDAKKRLVNIRIAKAKQIIKESQK